MKPKKRRRLIILIIILPVIIIALVCIIAAIKRNSRVEDVVIVSPLSVSYNVSYGTDPKQVYDLYTPAIQTDKLVILVHGGINNTGDKRQFDELSGYLQEQGFCTVNMNYRVTASSAYSNSFEDISTVAKHFETNKTECNLSTNYEIVLLGHSMGANLAVYVGLNEIDYNMKSADKVIGISGSYDFEYIINQNENAAIKTELLNVLGNTDAGDISPVNQVGKNEQTAFLFLHGDEDDFISLHHMEAMMNALDGKTCCKSSEVIPGYDHFSIITEISEETNITRNKIVDFIDN